MNLPEVVHRINPGIKSIRIAIKQGPIIHLTYPSVKDKTKAEAFLSKKEKWIEKKIAEQKIRQEKTHNLIAANPQISVEQAKAILRSRTEELARKYGFEYGNISFRNQKTRWGSCSGKNNISLNLKLARLPEILQNYVIIHELLHTRIKNHGREFRNALQLLIPDAQSREKELRSLQLTEM